MEDRLEPGQGEGSVKGDRGWITMGEEGSGLSGSFGILRLHEDEGLAVLGPVGFEEGWEGAVVAFEEKIREEGSLQIVKGGPEGGCLLF